MKLRYFAFSGLTEIKNGDIFVTSPILFLFSAESDITLSLIENVLGCGLPRDASNVSISRIVSVIENSCFAKISRCFLSNCTDLYSNLSCGMSWRSEKSGDNCCRELASDVVWTARWGNYNVYPI